MSDGRLHVRPGPEAPLTRLRPLLPLLASVLLHVGTPWALREVAELELWAPAIEEDEGDDVADRDSPKGPLPAEDPDAAAALAALGPFSVTVLDPEPPPPVLPVEPVAPPEPVEAPPEPPPGLPPEPLPPPEPPPPEPPPEPLPEDPLALLPAEILGDLDALANMEVTDAPPPEDDDDGAAVEKIRVRKGKNKPRKPRAPLEPCPAPIAEIVSTGPNAWTVDRGLVEYYATHLRELEQLAAVWTHRTDGVPDGFRIGLDRCSILRQAGLRSGDVVNTVNGRKIATVLQAVGAYFALRRETEITLHITRRTGPIELHYHLREADEMMPPRWESHDEKGRKRGRPAPIELDLGSLRLPPPG